MKKASLVLGICTVVSLAACSDRSPQVDNTGGTGSNYSTGSGDYNNVGTATGTDTAGNRSSTGATTNTPGTATGSSVSTSSGTTDYGNP